MGVDHGGAHVLVAQRLLDRSDVLPMLQQVSRVTWPKASVAEPLGVSTPMAAGCFGHPRVSNRPLHRLLHHTPTELVPPLGASCPVRANGSAEETLIARPIPAPCWGTCGPARRAGPRSPSLPLDRPDASDAAWTDASVNQGSGSRAAASVDPCRSHCS
jgi:hypothetical protein